ncbi:MAG: TIGR00282 family metallophosphoesterase [Solobacterium sp.]|nr:TIGR00282 family metallophosphoesterase [Solobacterium sp.]
MKILFLGDIVGKSGRSAVSARLLSLRTELQADLVIVNGENAAHGKGITTKIYRELKTAGADVITLGNHAFSKGEIKAQLDQCPDMIRPANMEPEDIGISWIVKEVCGKRVAVVNLLGSIFMDAATESPFAAMDRILPGIDADIIFVDLHAEATSEKEIFLHVYKDIVTAVIGTHTHVQTADEQIRDGCAYLSDAGMCGSFVSILGRDIDEVLQRTLNNQKTHFMPSEGPAILCGCLIETDDDTNRAVRITRIQERPE